MSLGRISRIVQNLDSFGTMNYLFFLICSGPKALESPLKKGEANIGSFNP
jgi:hypothetical protein